MSSALSRWARTDWFGPLAIVVAAVIVIGALKPAFLTPFNIQVLLSAVAVNAVIALSQMIIIGIGQMNLAVGAIGGLAAISFAGMMQVWVCRPSSPPPRGSASACWPGSSTASPSPGPASRPSSSPWRAWPSSRA